ncbi:hypothetical protein PC117_g25375 [Phytophthora cactorum]|uniref:Reverse transcriptase/retrotransposon-derived protein RNase H-like domain-containing protein n=2 Tax=Phytophthora cactorum TaxID=29920 RepID=A0A8T1ASJ8_9STRA|nr:hypothetical protein PC117_g25375 [Phytophthora cactorum]
MTDVEVHLEHQRPVFQVMRENKLYANLRKCMFCAPETPNQKHRRQWLGIATYLHNYSKNFVSTVRPLSRLLKANATRSWRSEHHAAFDAMKTIFSIATVLMLPDHSKPFHVVCDASDFAIGCALMQYDDDESERVMSYQSHQLKPAERNYPVHDKELLAMRYVLIKFRGRYGQRRKALICPNAWCAVCRFFSEYNFVVRYKPGKTNILADALSRGPDYDPRTQWDRHAVGDEEGDGKCAICVAKGVAAVAIAAARPLRDAIAAAYEHDAACSEMIKNLKAPSDLSRRLLPPRSRSRIDRYDRRSVDVPNRPRRRFHGSSSRSENPRSPGHSQCRTPRSREGLCDSLSELVQMGAEVGTLL